MRRPYSPIRLHHGRVDTEKSGELCVHSPVLSIVYPLQEECRHQHVTFLPSLEAVTAIRCWHAMLFLIRYNEERFSETLFTELQRT